MKRIAVALVTVAALVASCDAATSPPRLDPATTFPPIDVEPSAVTSASQSTTTDVPTTGPPLVAGGCSIFSGSHLGQLTRMSLPLTLIITESSDYQLYCGLIGVEGGRDASAVIVVAPLTDRTEGHYRTADEFETEIDVAGLRGVATGRGSLRTELDGTLGLTLTVGLRTLRSDVTAFTDGEHLEIRDAVAAYVVEQLSS